MKLHDYILLIHGKLVAAYEANNLEEYKRLTTLLRDTCNDIIEGKTT